MTVTFAKEFIMNIHVCTSQRNLASLEVDVTNTEVAGSDKESRILMR